MLLNLSCVSNLYDSVLQKCEMNFVSLFDTIDLGTPCRCTMSLKKSLAIWEASFVLLHGRKCTILDNLSTTTKMESNPTLVFGRPSTKSIERSIQGSVGTGNVVYILMLCFVPLKF